MNKTHQKTIVFDLGKVLLSFDFQIAANQLAKHAQLNANEIVGLINQSQLLHEARYPQRSFTLRWLKRPNIRKV